MKICKVCKFEKPITQFHKQKDGKFGCRPECKDCANSICRAKNNPIATANKYCSSCRIEKNYTEFTRRKKASDGLNNKCKVCSSAYSCSDKRRKKRNERVNQRRQEDSKFKLIESLRNRLYKALTAKFWKKNTNFANYIGCDHDFLHSYIEKMFSPGMSWENRNEWHIDHIIPLSSAINEDEIIKLCHYTNLQPLWSIDNLTKNDLSMEEWLKLKNKDIND